MQRLQIPQKLVREKFYVHEKILHEIAAVELSKLYFLKNAKKLCKPNNRDLNRDCIINVMQTLKNLFYKGALFM